MGGNNRGGIPWPLILVLLVTATPIGVILLLVKLFENRSGYGGNANRTYSPPNHGQRPAYGYRGDQPGAAQGESRDGGRTYQPAAPGEYHAAPDQGPSPSVERVAPGGGYQAGQKPNYRGKFDPQTLSLQQQRKLFRSRGKGWQITGTVLLLIAAFTSVAVFLDNAAYYDFFGAIADAMMATAVMGFPGAASFIYGNHLRGRSFRCQQYYTMIGGRRTVDIRELAAAIPVSYGKACKDLQWMITEGFFPGAYIDASRRCLTYPNAPAEVEYRGAPKPVATPQPVKEEKPQPKPQPEKPGVFEDVEKIRRLNDEIADAFVSDRLCRLEELTLKILTYVQDHPKREDRIRQFKDHYLPKTLKILESYSRFEKQGVSGANIRSAMKDVEEIMDTLVSGFEKQLDMLFDDEALDVSTDINVLESMMGLQGLRSEDPFQLGLLSDEL